MLIRTPARVGKYTLLRHLSSGGMADLYEARLMGIENFRRSIAIKVVRSPEGLSSEEAAEFVDMFINEARVCGQLTHANIAQVYELGKVEGLPYMAMELVEGHSLAQVARKARADEVDLPLAFVAYLLAQTATGLDYAHRRTSLEGEALNIVHRDVSPDNILISYEGEVKLIDFGVAQVREQRRKTEDGLRGKLPYMAPEQARQESVDARTDVFGLGAVLYEMVAGRRLYLSSGMELLVAAQEGALPDFDRTLEGVPSELREVIERCLALEPQARYGSAAEVARAVQPFTIQERSVFGADDTAHVVQQRYP
ncbi:MAG: serine/threonine-protein kinase, partial [Myxococcota bacterium]